MPEQTRTAQRHERLLDAALQVFANSGYHRATVDEIAIASDTSKGGFYFHFPTKQSVFLALLDRMAALLRSRAEEAIAAEHDPIARADAALRVAFETFAGHRRLTRLFFVEALGAGKEFHERLAETRAAFAELVRVHLDDAVRQGVIPPVDTRLASRMWFGALNEVVTAWVLTEPAGSLEDSYPTVRDLLFRSVGIAPGGRA